VDNHDRNDVNVRARSFRDRIISLECVEVFDGPKGPCEGKKWKRSRVLPCKLPARYRYTQHPEDAVDNNEGDSSGNYCWSHLIHRGLIGTDADYFRHSHLLTGPAPESERDW
jgi:hypothetical protein